MLCGFIHFIYQLNAIITLTQGTNDSAKKLETGILTKQEIPKSFDRNSSHSKAQRGKFQTRQSSGFH